MYVGEEPLSFGTVILHHLTDGSQGDLDSMRVGSDGAFAFRLPGVPDPARNDVYFSSVRHDGVLYFGPAITTAIQLDSLYEIHAFDTLLAPPSGFAVPLQSRSIFLEPDAGTWKVTDLFLLRNDEDRTIVAQADGMVWAYPLPRDARDVVAGEGELAFDAATYENGNMVVRAALPPGERLFVVRYVLDDIVESFPTPGVTETLDVLIREPAPGVAVEGIESIERIELEAGTTYRRFTDTNVTSPFLRIIETEEAGPPPVEWIAVFLAMVLTVSGLVVLTRGGLAPAGASGADRQSLLLQVARLDEEIHAGPEPTERQRAAYEKRRGELLRRLRSTP